MNYTEYFQERNYKPTYYLGDRVRGRWQDRPFSGTVAIDSNPYVNGTPTVKVFLDLPLVIDGALHTMISVTHDDIGKSLM